MLVIKLVPIHSMRFLSIVDRLRLHSILVMLILAGAVFVYRALLFESQSLDTPMPECLAMGTRQSEGKMWMQLL